MNYLQDRKIKRRRLSYAALIAAFFAIFYIFHSEIFGGLSSVGNTVFRPFVSLGNSAGKKIGNLATYFASKSSLEGEVAELNQKIMEGEGRTANYNLLLAENSELKEILNRRDPKKEMILAAILAKPNVSLYDTILVDAGEREEVKKGNKVFALGNVPIGSVAEVYAHTSKIILFSSAGLRTPVRTGSSIVGKNIFLEAVGRGGGDLEIILPRNYTPTTGEEIVLPGITPAVIAMVESVVSDPRDPFVRALLTAPVNIQELNFVEIEK